MKQLYIFDFDGTLVNTFYDSVLAYNRALRKHGLPEYAYDKLSNIDYKDFISNMSHDEEVLTTYQHEYEDSKKEYTLPYPQIKETLKKLEEKEIELAICSNRIQYQLEEYTKKLFSDINFRYIIGFEIGKKAKPDPEMMNKIINNTRYSRNEILYIGDKKTDIITAQNVDVDCMIVTWGQGDDDVYKSSYPLKIIDKPMELLEL